MQPVLDAIGFLAQSIGGMVADHVAAVEAANLVLDRVDPRLQRTNLAVVVMAIPVVPVVLRRRIILSGSRARHDKSGACGGKRKNQLTHSGSP